MFFNPDLSMASIQFSYLLLESNRIYIKKEMETNFHILNSMILATGHWKKELNLDIARKYKVNCQCKFNENFFFVSL